MQELNATQKTNARGGELRPRALCGTKRERSELEVPVAVDAARHAVLLAIEHTAVAGREAATIEGAHGSHFAMNAGFAALEAECLAAGELPVSDTGCDAMLLVKLTLGNVVVAGRHLRLHKSRSAKKCCSECNGREFHRVPSFCGFSVSFGPRMEEETQALEKGCGAKNRE